MGKYFIDATNKTFRPFNMSKWKDYSTNSYMKKEIYWKCNCCVCIRDKKFITRILDTIKWFENSSVIEYQRKGFNNYHLILELESEEIFLFFKLSMA